MKKVAVVTGGTSGVGLHTALNLKKAGCLVYIISRHNAEISGLIHISADITDEAQAKAAAEQIIAENGRIDILVNNAGFGISGAVEFTDSETAHKQLELNLFGTDNMTRAVLPQMRAQGSGRIICMSSLAGIAPIPFQTWYSVSKAGVLSYALALQNEVRPFGISITAIMPGDINTGFTAARQKSSLGDDIYNGRLNRSVAKMEKDELNGLSAEYAGSFVARYALMKHSRPVIAMSKLDKLESVLLKLLPRSVTNRLLYDLYAG